MAKSYAIELQDVEEGTGRNKADGRIRNAGVRSSRSTFNATTTPTTTGDTLSLGTFKKGDCIKAFGIVASTNMAAASIAIGTAADPDKFLAAAALPNATNARRMVAAAAAGYDPLETDDELIVTISGATIPNGDLTIYTEFTRR